MRSYRRRIWLPEWQAGQGFAGSLRQIGWEGTGGRPHFSVVPSPQLPRVPDALQRLKRCGAEPGLMPHRRSPKHGPRLCSASLKRRCAASGARDHSPVFHKTHQLWTSCAHPLTIRSPPHTDERRLEQVISEEKQDDDRATGCRMMRGSRASDGRSSSRTCST
jgi:hypothetical protein